MAPIAWSDVLDATDNDPVLVAYGVPGQTLILNSVNTRLDVSMFDGEDGPSTKLARAFLAAHMAIMIKRGDAGPVQSESEGGVSVTYAIPYLQSRYASTSYGLMFRECYGAQAFAPRVLGRILPGCW